ncbi:flagellar filament capping protein FliD [Pseudomonas sp. HR96]|uniref:flagellar filament capping protein FliD n=1 Tax=Pseudomonas sp. HR96 TaxID=1027966 RepID=UPI002A75F840|nr:flagellar filament capping protein FliD [Pseudomonas sp. HR96]WPP00056.1 flagellar filament capping protein FliD [Pseudomonas sp. HR96]
MAFDSEYIKGTAQNLADYEVRRAFLRVQRNETRVKTQLDGLNALDKALKALSSAVKDMKKADKGMLVNSATFSKPDFASATVGASAVAGSYDFFVEQLASRHQLAVSGLRPEDLGSGTLTLSQDGKSFDIDMTGIDSLEALAAQINGATDNSGLKATLVRTGGEVSLVLSSDKTGAAQAIGVSHSGTSPGFAGAMDGATELAAAQDAKVRLGGENGLLLTSTSNTFDQVIDGVSLTFSKAHAPGDTPLTVEIAQDKSATREKVQAFVDAINGLLGEFDSLTASGGKGGERGALAGDASIRSMESLLGGLLRGQYDGVSLMQFGIVADAKGKLTIDSKNFEKAVAADPEAFEKLFSGEGNLFDALDKQLATYSASGGLIKSRKDSLDAQMRRVDAETERLEKQHEMFYQRYLKQYSNMARIIASMEATYGMF